MATCRNYLSILSENFIKIGSAEDLLYAGSDRHSRPCFSSFSTTSQTYDVINVAVTSRFRHPAFCTSIPSQHKLDRVKRIWYLSAMRAAKVQASLRIRAVSPEPPLLAHTSSESRGTFRQKARSLASPSGWACTVKTCHDGMLEDTNSLDGAQLMFILFDDHANISRKKRH